jgi:outer membrane protein assembly factor BamB
MLYRIIPVLSFIFFISACSQPEKLSQWRGPQRNGIYPEKGLLKTWPEKGPDMLWSFQGLGAGHGGVGFTEDKIFILGMPDTIGIIYALDYNGKLLWKKNYGTEWHENYTGPRSTPTIIGEYVYFLSGQGTVFCFNSNTGDKIWSVDLLKKFDAPNITWGMTESLLIEGDRLFCTPGGKENNIVALNRFTGETIWTSPGSRQPSAYCSPIFVKHNKTNLVVTMTAESIIGVDALTGQCYWQVPQFQDNMIHANTPVYSEGNIYCSSTYSKTNSGLVSLKLSGDGKSVTTQWRNENYKNLMGGIIVTDGHIYGSVYRESLWCCVDTSNGQIIYSSDKFGSGNIIMADSMLYCYSEKGEMALVSASDTSFNVISRFKIPLGSDQHWSHPDISGGILYVRHGDALMAFNVKDT